eukprot:4941854-Pyramimonas_sp.AAC.1
MPVRLLASVCSARPPPLSPLLLPPLCPLIPWMPPPTWTASASSRRWLRSRRPVPPCAVWRRLRPRVRSLGTCPEEKGEEEEDKEASQRYCRLNVLDVAGDEAKG